MRTPVVAASALRTWPRHLLAAAICLGFATTAQAQNKCSASGVMGGEKFIANHCAVSLLDEAHSVTFWFSENPLSPQEVEAFEISAYASSIKDGKERTMLLVGFCPGGGQAVASAGSIKRIDLAVNHGKSAMAANQWIVEAPKDFKVVSITGTLKAGSKLAGRITGSRTSDGQPYSWDLTFDVTLPTKDAASGVTCGK